MNKSSAALADRMRRKYVDRLGEDGEKFEQYIDVITRQAGDIRRMVDEFSRFARLPEPEMKEENLVDLTESALVLQREGRSDITYESHLPNRAVPQICDRGLINQCLVNLLQNSADAIEARQDADDAPPGKIVVQLTVGSRSNRLLVIDNGIGLPRENRERLKEPYVTNRANGTGLGLSIVARIIEQHGGEISLGDAAGVFGQDGALVEIRLPRPAEWR
ncbi:MAG: ATP-binding protein [Pseudomonadota bacterium]